MSDPDLPMITVVHRRALTVFTPFTGDDEVLGALIDTLDAHTSGYGIAQPVALQDVQAEVMAALASARIPETDQQLEKSWRTLHRWLNPDFSR